MSLKSFLLLGVIGIASIVGAADTLMAQAEIEPGKWCNDYLAARAYALERNVPMLVIWNNPGSFYCEQLEKACAQPDFVSWQEERKIVMVFVVGKDTPTQQAAYDWIRSVREIVDYPYVGVYWLNNSEGETVETVFVGRNGKMPETDGSLQKQLMSTIDSLVVDWDPSVNSKLTPFKPIDDDEPVVTNTVTYAGLDSAINTNVTKFTASDLPLSLGPLEQAGWRFIGWTPNDGVIPAGTLTNVSFTAKWEQIVEKKLDGGPYSEIIGGIEWTYFVKNDESEVCGCSTAVGAITIPKTLGCCPVTRIGSYAFSGCIELTSVTIPDGVTGIGTDAFSGCSGLISIEIPSTVKMIDWGVFRYCNKLESVTMPNCVDRLSDVFPESCQTITNVVICDGVKCIKSRAFENCKGLASVDIPSSVTEIGERAFAGCTSLKSVAIPNGVSRIGFLAFEDCSSLEYVEISDVSAWCRIDFSNSLESNPAYYGHRLILGNKELRDLDIPDDVTEISGFAFAGCKRLRSVNMSASVTNIAVGAFYGCDNIFGFNVDQDNSNYTSVWGGLCTKDGKTLIAGVGIYGYTIIPDGVTQIGDYAYSDNNVLTSVRISTNVISVAKSAFSGCSKIRYVTMPPCITELAEYFSSAYEKIYQVDILDGVTRICDRAFYGCSGLTSVTISSSVTNIGNYAFGGCKKMSSIAIPQSVTHIGDFAFKDCRLLSSIFIPSNVTEIGIDVFSGCDQICLVL